jgi:exportin-7
MTGIRGIMTSKKGLDKVENYHEFCRLLGRLKASYQLSELVKTTGFVEWLELAGDFTIKSLQNWQYSMNSIHYLLALWGRLVAALPYLRADATDSQRQATVLRQCVLQVVESYINTMIDSVEVVVASEGMVEDPLEDEGSLREQLDRLPVIARLQYDIVAQFMVTMFERSLGIYQECCNMANPPAQQMEILEGRMTWMTYMIGAIIGSQGASDPRKNQTEMIWDGRLCRYVFQLVQMVDFRMSNSGGKMKCDEKLEVAILASFRSFKKSYMLDTVNGPSMGMIPGGSPAHPLLSLALSYSPGGNRLEEKDGMGSEATSVYDAMGIGDSASVMSIVVNKMCNNIKYWHRSDKILEETLDVFVELVSSYSSSKTLLSLETVNFLVHNHVGAHFPFLGYDSDNKYRITFYSALSRLVFSSSEDLLNQFDAFIAPNLAVIAQLNQTQDLRAPAVKVAIIGALRDLRGITCSTYNKRTYNLLFDALYPE